MLNFKWYEWLRLGLEFGAVMIGLLWLGRWSSTRLEKNPVRGAPGMLLLLVQVLLLLSFVGLSRVVRRSFGELDLILGVFILLPFIVALCILGVVGFGHAFGLFQQRRATWVGVGLVVMSTMSFVVLVTRFPDQKSHAVAPDTLPQVAPPPDTLSIIRSELDQRYEENRRAFLAKDFDAIMSLRTPDFHTITADHAVHERAEMEQATHELLNGTDRWEDLTFHIDTLGLFRGMARVNVVLSENRLAHDSDGRVHGVRVASRRCEDWRRTPDGWRLYRIEAISGEAIVDNRRAVGPILLPNP